jgi:hypothetical protein
MRSTRALLLALMVLLLACVHGTTPGKLRNVASPRGATTVAMYPGVTAVVRGELVALLDTALVMAIASGELVFIPLRPLALIQVGPYVVTRKIENGRGVFEASDQSRSTLPGDYGIRVLARHPILTTDQLLRLNRLAGQDSLIVADNDGRFHKRPTAALQSVR